MQQKKWQIKQKIKIFMSKSSAICRCHRNSSSVLSVAFLSLQHSSDFMFWHFNHAFSPNECKQSHTETDHFIIMEIFHQGLKVITQNNYWFAVTFPIEGQRGPNLPNKTHPQYSVATRHDFWLQPEGATHWFAASWYMPHMHSPTCREYHKGGVDRLFFLTQHNHWPTTL